MLLRHHNKDYALGLMWASAHDAGEARRESKSRPKAHRVLLPAGGQFWIGLYDEPVKRNTYAAALAVGLVEPNVIVCEQVNDAQTWVCSIVDGLPVVGYDLLVPNDEARDTVAQWTSMFVKAQFIGDLPGAKSSLVEVLDALAKAIKSKSKSISAKQLAAIRLQRQGISVGSIATMTAILCIPLAGWFGWQAWLKIKASSTARQLSMASAAKHVMNAERAAAERRERIEDFRRQVAVKRAELERQGGTPPEPVWRQWNAVRRALPIIAHGYKPMSMSCDTASCKVDWTGAGPFTLPSDKRLLPGVLPNVEPTLAATSQFPLTPPGTTRAPLYAYTAPEALWFALASAATVSLPGLQVDAMQPVVVSPPPELGLSPVTIGAVGKLRIALNGPTALVLADDVYSFLSLWPVQLTSIRFDALGLTAGAISIEGTYILNGQP